jgi:hypothetical protein
MLGFQTHHPVRAAVALGAIVVLLGMFGCELREPRIERYRKEVRFDRPLVIRPGAAGAQAAEGCMNGSYLHRYTITSGINAGEVWLCCVPIAELLRDSFRCGGIMPVYLGTPADAKVQTCSLVNATSPTGGYIPACIQAPYEASIDHAPGT